MSMHRVSEHREEDEEDQENESTLKKASGESPDMAKRGRSATKGKNGQPLLFNNQWTLDDEERQQQHDEAAKKGGRYQS